MKYATPRSAKARTAPASSPLQLGCLASSPPAVRSAVDHGADWIRVPYRLVERNSVHLCDNRLENALQYVHDKGRMLVLDLGALPDSLAWKKRCEVISWACDIGIDAVVLSDAALALYCTTKHPGLPLHFAGPDTLSAKSALRLMQQLGATRILIPRTISIARLEEIAKTDIELEVQGSDRIVGDGDDDACNDSFYSPDELVAAALRQLPRLLRLGVRTIQVEAKSGTPNEVARVVRVWRAAIDKCAEDASHFEVNPGWTRLLAMHLPS